MPPLSTCSLKIMIINRLSPAFNYFGQNISLHADVPFYPSPTLAQQLKRLAQTCSISALFQLTHTQDPTHHQPSPTPPSDLHTHPSLDHLLHQFDDNVWEPQQLPPHRNITHHIHLLPNSNPVNVQLYCYPYSQKNKSERQVVVMLDAGMIQPSHSPFSSPIQSFERYHH